MTRFMTCAIVCAIVALPVSAGAAESDAAYCAALAQKYQRYVSAGESSRRGQQPDANVETAIGRCRSDSASAIPVLEQALRNARIDLPTRG
jgi:hypothetical protein